MVFLSIKISLISFDLEKGEQSGSFSLVLVERMSRDLLKAILNFNLLDFSMEKYQNMS